jgi:hypothetical protein
MKLWRENEQDSVKRRLTIFVDANTIVSGLLFDGNEALLLRLGETGSPGKRHLRIQIHRFLRGKDFN